MRTISQYLGHVPLTLKNCRQSLSRLAARLNGATIEYNLKRYHAVVKQIRAKANHYRHLSDGDLLTSSEELRSRYRSVQQLDELAVDAFALVAEAVLRHLGLRVFDEQLIAGLVLHEGKLAQMQTGEGKTLAAVFPAYLNGLNGRGVKVLTFNDYLAERDALWMGSVYRSLGLSVGSIKQGMCRTERREAYAMDITYLTAKEFGFDYLRDSLVFDAADRVQGECHYAIVDEADSILIDEARVPLVLAASVNEESGNVGLARSIVKALDFSTHTASDDYQRNIVLSDAGVRQVEAMLGVQNLYAERHNRLVADINYALHAEHLLHRGVDYLVKDGDIQLVDEFTGRIAERRRWADGLHEAVAAKESTANPRSGRILNSITLQHLLRHCYKLSGMSATCETSTDEFQRFYDLTVVVIPPHRPSIRRDRGERVFRTLQPKQAAVVREILQAHNTGRPVLVGTQSVSSSNQLAKELERHRLSANVLNAENDAEEAAIIAEAGRLGAVTISTNMAGRGTDIVLGGKNGEERAAVKRLGGLCVIGTHCNESPRIDRQLRGRAGRQGDPGESVFFVSLEDTLCRRYNLAGLLPARVLESLSEAEITSPLTVKKLRQLQHVIDDQSFQLRTTLIDYSHMVEQQRQVVVEYRSQILTTDLAVCLLKDSAPAHYRSLLDSVEGPELSGACRTLLLWCLDREWSEHLASARDLQDKIHLQTLGGHTPLFEYQKAVSRYFSAFFDRAIHEATAHFTALVPIDGRLDLSRAGISAPSSTWTYQVNDAFFDDMRDRYLQQPGFSAGVAVFAGPLLLLSLWLNKLRRKRP